MTAQDYREMSEMLDALLWRVKEHEAGIAEHDHSAFAMLIVFTHGAQLCQAAMHALAHHQGTPLDELNAVGEEFDRKTKGTGILACRESLDTAVAFCLTKAIKIVADATVIPRDKGGKH